MQCSSLSICTQCNYGYFLYNTVNSTVECVKCPFLNEWQDPAVEDKECVECIENPLSWQLNRKC